MPDGFLPRRNFDHLRQLTGAADAEDLRPVAKLRAIPQRQRVQVPAVAFERILLDERRPPRGDGRRRLLLDRQQIIHLAVERYALLRRDDQRGG